MAAGSLSGQSSPRAEVPRSLDFVRGTLDSEHVFDRKSHERHDSNFPPSPPGKGKIKSSGVLDRKLRSGCIAIQNVADRKARHSLGLFVVPALDMRRRCAVARMEDDEIVSKTREGRDIGAQLSVAC